MEKRVSHAGSYRSVSIQVRTHIFNLQLELVLRPTVGALEYVSTDSSPLIGPRACPGK